MFKKKIKVQIPKKNKCSNCGKQAKLDDIDQYYITLKNVCVATYSCECGQKDTVKKEVKFI